VGQEAARTDEEGKSQVIEERWVMCDAPECQKWRKIPDTGLFENLSWRCYMNPDMTRNRCSDQEETW